MIKKQKEKDVKTSSVIMELINQLVDRIVSLSSQVPETARRQSGKA